MIELKLGNRVFQVCVNLYSGDMSPQFQVLIGMDLIKLLQLKYDPKVEKIISEEYNLDLPVRGPGGPWHKKVHLGVINNQTPDTAERKSAMINEISLEHLSVEDRGLLSPLLHENTDVFARNPMEIGVTNLIEHSIQLTDEIPIYKRPYKVAQAHKGILQENVEELLKAGVIKHSSSPYASPCLLVFAPGKKPRMVVDYRELNKKTVGDRYPLPNIEALLQTFGGARYYSVMDFSNGF